MKPLDLDGDGVGNVGTAAERLSTAGRAGSFASAGLRREQPEMEEMEDSGFRSNRQTGKTADAVVKEGIFTASVLRLPEPEDRRFFRAASGQAGEVRNPSPAPAATPCPNHRHLA